ncbi:MAG: hypothetical protein M1837_006254 [Sclerophora amabilis]|nr:MAG: hypothetical protein M1837_006254 [Sclerophora amabilis]
MGLLEVGELLPFPPGDNSTDTIINGIHFNKTALNFFNYTLWGNDTLSNGSKCYLSFERFQPILLKNGTVLNGTSCYEPYYGIQERGTLGITFGCLFALSLMFSLINLRKHGRLFVRQEKRFRASFFMTIPRSWTKIEYQRDAAQQLKQAKPVAIDGRFKAAAIFAFLAWCVICYSLRHSIYYYKPRTRGVWNRFNSFLHWAPTKLLLIILVSFITVGYFIALVFDWNISPLKYDVNPAWIYGLGYAPILLTMIIFQIWGYIDENEDRVILRQRRERDRSTDHDLGIAKKPGWWSKRHGEGPMDVEGRLRALTTEIGGGPPTQHNIEQSLEMGNMPSGRRPPAGEVFADSPERYRDTFATGDESRRMSRRSDSTTTTTTTASTLNAPQTRVRSMLDV